MGGRSRGSELLRLFRKARGLSQAGLASYLRPPRPWAATLIRAWETGACRPRPSRRRILERLTHGQVPATAWVSPPEYQPGQQLSLIDCIEATPR